MTPERPLRIPVLPEADRSARQQEVVDDLVQGPTVNIYTTVVRHPELPLGKFLNAPPIVHIGRISYSIYLWHVLFVGDRTHSFPLNLVWIFLCSEASYWLVEQPFLRLRDRVVRSSSSVARKPVLTLTQPSMEEAKP